MPARARQRAGGDLAPAFAAVRVRLGLVVVLFALVGLGWWWTARAMGAMDMGPWTALGEFGFFLGAWVVMMYAMMFPSVAPTVALYARMTRSRDPLLPALFSVGYLAVWAGAGLVAYAIGAIAPRLFGDALAWNHAGRVVAAVTLLLAAGYQLTPLKDACLSKCRSPLGFLLGVWRDGRVGALQMGAKEGAWCLGCCWAIMASLFALGVMSMVWMAVLTAVITIEKILPWRRVATYATTVLLFTLGIALLVAPGVIPALTVPIGGAPAMPEMGP